VDWLSSQFPHEDNALASPCDPTNYRLGLLLSQGVDPRPFILPVFQDDFCDKRTHVLSLSEKSFKLTHYPEVASLLAQPDPGFRIIENDEHGGESAGRIADCGLECLSSVLSRQE